MLPTDTVTEMDCFTAMTQIPDESVDIVLTDPPYPNGMRLFQNSILDGYAALYYCCKKAKNVVVFFWSPQGVPLPPRGWYEVARHVWWKPDAASRNSYEVIVVWSKDYRRLSSRVWSIPILDYRSLKDWSSHPTQKPVKLIRYLLDLYTNEGDIVLDPFVGSGTVAVACKQMHRHFIAIEHDPAFVAIANKRLRERTMPEARAPEPPRHEELLRDTPPRDDGLPEGEAPYDDIPLDEGDDGQGEDAYPELPPVDAQHEERPIQRPAEKRSHHTTRSAPLPDRPTGARPNAHR